MTQTSKYFRHDEKKRFKHGMAGKRSPYGPHGTPVFMGPYGKRHEEEEKRHDEKRDEEKRNEE